MKIKLDYVTNSSSTGYVFYGYTMGINDERITKFLEGDWDPDSVRKGLNLPKCVDIRLSDWNSILIIGKLISMAHDDCGIDIRKVDLDNLMTQAKQAAKVVKEIFKFEGEPRLISGVDGQS
jgi:hypothetical protein